MSTSIRPDTTIDAAKSMLKLPEARKGNDSGHHVE
jgi:hypothetical protein